MRTKIIMVLVALMGWGLAIWSLSRPAPKPQIEVRYKTVTKDRIAVKKLQEKVTKPDGTVIERHVATGSREVRKASESVLKRSPLSKYSLGLSARSDLVWPLKPQYTLELGKRLWESPVWITTSISTDRSVTLGIRYEF